MSRRPLRILTAVAALGLTLAACSTESESTEETTDGSSNETSSGDASANGGTVTISTNNGEVEVPVQPDAVAVLDNTAAETVFEFGVIPVAIPKTLFPAQVQAWIDDESIVDIGNHREPQLEQLDAAQPELIIGGYRFRDYQSDLESIATTIDIAPQDEEPGQFVEGLVTQTEALGQIFGEEERAAEIISAFEEARDSAIEATNGETVFLAVVSGGQIDNGAGRIGRIIEPLELTDVFADEDLDSESVHQDSGMAPETVAQANPDWLIVLDRDAATSTGEGSEPARAVIEAQEAWENTTFAQNDQIIYLDDEFYTRESIQAFTEAYEQIAEALGN